MKQKATPWAEPIKCFGEDRSGAKKEFPPRTYRVRRPERPLGVESLSQPLSIQPHVRRIEISSEDVIAPGQRIHLDEVDLLQFFCD